MLTARYSKGQPQVQGPTQADSEQTPKQSINNSSNMINAQPSLYNLVIKSRWRLMSTLGKGAFGEVYLAADMLTNTHVAVKIESPGCKKQVLKLEISVMRKLQDCPYVAHHIGAGRFTWPYAANLNPNNASSITVDMLPPEHPVYSYMVMDLLGQNLSELRRKSPSGRFSISTTAILGRQMLRGIQALHEVGILHRDIKPGNFCMSLPIEKTKQRCFLIDFGLSRRYMSTHGRVREARQKVGFRGTARYASINAHLGMELCRADDLWSLFYLLVEFLVGTLPWKGKEKDTIGDLKINHTNPSLVAGLPPCMLSFMDVLLQTQYETTPRYDVIDACLISLGNTVAGEEVWDENGNGVALYDWEIEGFGTDIDIAVLRDSGVLVNLEDVDARRRHIGDLLDGNEDVFKMSDSELAIGGGDGFRHNGQSLSTQHGGTGVTDFQNATGADPLTSSTAASSSFQNGALVGNYLHSPNRRFSEQSQTSLNGAYSNYGSPPIISSISGLPRWERQNSISSLNGGADRNGLQQGGILMDNQGPSPIMGRRFSGGVSGLTVGFERIGLGGTADDFMAGRSPVDDDPALMEKMTPPPLPYHVNSENASLPANLPTPPAVPVPMKKTDVRYRHYKFPSTESK
ncbi:kinase-like domain-containing protein [Chytriomyces cf. hyalinus JEL632]|nr:kinase-like domain-containing protein [Chytriomyces cf. hyalinus JEL632]